MKTIIAGSRKGAIMRYVVDGAREIQKATNRTITEVVCGCCEEGGDALGKEWARQASVPVKDFPADWYPGGRHDRMDRAAGQKRNRRMADYADALVAIWDGKSPGTKGMIEFARKKGIPIVIVHYGNGLVKITIEIPLL